tara:strand:- start:1132 stop:1602 length:471 start_codon:yes stop_codon:yes gene_type:complete
MGGQLSSPEAEQHFAAAEEAKSKLYKATREQQRAEAEVGPLHERTKAADARLAIARANVDKIMKNIATGVGEYIRDARSGKMRLQTGRDKIRSAKALEKKASELEAVERGAVPTVGGGIRKKKRKYSKKKKSSRRRKYSKRRKSSKKRRKSSRRKR